MPEIDEKRIKKTYIEHQQEIESRIKEFKHLRNAAEQRIFRELVFVILTSRNSAREAWKASKKLEREDMLSDPDREEVLEFLEKFDISFEARKSGFIVKSFEDLSQPTLKDPSGGLKISSRIDPDRLQKTRRDLTGWPGLGWKGASHFLRNIGYGGEFGIVSSHVSKTLHALGLVESPAPPSSEEEYLETEKKLRDLSSRLDIELEALDLAIWASRTGEVFR